MTLLREQAERVIAMGQGYLTRPDFPGLQTEYKRGTFTVRLKHAYAAVDPTICAPCRAAHMGCPTLRRGTFQLDLDMAALNRLTPAAVHVDEDHVVRCERDMSHLDPHTVTDWMIGFMMATECTEGPASVR